MKCPKCNSEIKNGKCDLCNKELADIYFKLVEEEQGKRNYKKALIYLKELSGITSDEDILKEVERIGNGIQFSNYGIQTSIISDAGDSTIEHKKKRKKELVYSSFRKMLLLTVILLSIIALYELFGKKYYENLVVKDNLIKERKLDMTLLFHLNQGTYPFSNVADKTSYEGLIRTLLKHPKLKFNLQISGTLIQNLMWYESKTLDLIKEGVAKGQFEILGSTYSQNILYSTDSISNQWQIERHKELIKKVFDVTPVTFWNPERTWKQEIAPLLLKNGYEITLIEDHILKDSGSKYNEHILRTTENKLLIVNDDNKFLDYLNQAVDAGDNENKREDYGANLSKKRKEYKKFYKYIRNIYEKDKNDTFVLNYAEDGEATGLWDWENGKNSEWDFINLDFLLTSLEEKDWIETKKYSELKNKKKQEDLTPIVDGVAVWMSKAAKGVGKYSEKGYESWFDFNKNSPKLNNYRKDYAKYTKFIKENENNKKIAIQNLMKLAKENLLSHQFEFGCTGISGRDEDWKNGRKYSIWENVKTISVIEEAVSRINNYKDEIYIKDINRDNIKEIIVVNKNNFYVFSKARGGRLLFWYDLEKGIEIVGGELGTKAGEQYYDGNFPIVPLEIKDNVRFMTGSDDLLEYLRDTKFNVRQKALNEKLLLEKENGFEYIITDIYKAEMDYSISNNSQLVFKYNNFIKTISFDENGFNIKYQLPKDVKGIKIVSEFQPDYYAMINNGQKSIETESIENGIIVKNVITNNNLIIKTDVENEITEENSMFGKIIILKSYNKNIMMEIRKDND